MAVRDRVSEHRRRMRERGYRPVQMWVPDVRTREFGQEAARQAALVASDPTDDTLDYLEEVGVDWGEE